MDNSAHVYLLPISGGHFVNQIALLNELMRAGSKRPDLMLGNSGGAVASFLTLAGNWTERGTLRAAYSIPSNAIAIRWPVWGRVLPPWLMGVIKGSFYASDKREPVEALFESIFDKKTVTRAEIWVGTTLKTDTCTQLFCNRSQSDSVLACCDDEEDDLLNCLPPIYLDGDVTRVAKAAVASATIPTIAPPKELDKKKYVDGGVMFATPFVPLRSRIRQFVGTRPLHMTIVNGYDPSKIVEFKNAMKLYADGLDALTKMQNSMALHCRLAALEFVRGSGAMATESGICTSEKLAEIVARREKYSRSLLELTPGQSISIDMIKFTPQDIDDAVKKSRTSYHYTLRWVL